MLFLHRMSLCEDVALPHMIFVVGPFLFIEGFDLRVTKFFLPKVFGASSK